MDFSLTDEQTMLADSVSRFIENEYPFEEQQRIAASERGFSTTIWRKFAELGWTAVPFSEEDGGLGGGAVELMLLMEAFGRGLVVEPFVPTIVLAGGIFKRSGTPEQKERWLSPLIAGDLQAAVAFAEPQARFNPCDIVTTATPSGGGYVISGRKAVVLNGSNADILVVPARTGGLQRDMAGISLFLLTTDAPGLQRRPYRTVDGHRAAEIVLEDVKVPGDALLGAVGEGGRVLLETIDEATLAVCAEAFGIICALQEKTVEYTKSRIQFGTPISSFQALQHRMVDMLMAREQLHSLLTWAVMLAAGQSSDAVRAISALKYYVGTAGRHVAQEAVQLHGGMGVTWELDVAHYFKRLTTIEILFGNADYHMDRFCRLGGAT